MIFNKRLGRSVLFAIFCLFIIGSSVFFYKQSIDVSSLQGKLNSIPQWMKDQMGNKGAEEIGDGDGETPENVDKPAL